MPQFIVHEQINNQVRGNIQPESLNILLEMLHKPGPDFFTAFVSCSQKSTSAASIYV